MDIQKEYTRWKDNAKEPELASELSGMSADTINDAFCRNLEFGTGGLRGVLGAGTNRMNIYTVGKATQGICNFLNAQKSGASVAIAYDSRINSYLFAQTTAGVFAANGITAHIYKELMPTPLLSYAVRSLGCDAGAVVTASHNPAKYNGYKVYGPDGCQITLDIANAVLAQINKVDIFSGIKKMPFEEGLAKGLIKYIPDETLDNFIAEVEKCSVDRDICKAAGLSVIYTPLNGTGNKPVRKTLARAGLKEFKVVPAQENPDGHFPTCLKPNPEERSAFAEALKLAETSKPDLLLATDPDCDRMGIAVRNNAGEYVLFTGNETGCLLLHYILSQRKEKGTLPKSPVVVKTIVTSKMAYKIAEEFGAKVVDTLTGFKFIGEQIAKLEKEGHPKDYVFGFEESYGSLPGTYVRDKDAVAASLLTCEMASYYKSRGMSLCDALDGLYKRYGAYRQKLLSFAFEGADGMDKMNRIMGHLREEGITEIAGDSVTKTEDYLKSESTDAKTGKKTKLTLPKSNVLVFTLAGGAEVIVRPSGTEPKLKAYLTAIGETVSDGDKAIEKLESGVKGLIG